jgi:hypothetical protein
MEYIIRLFFLLHFEYNLHILQIRREIMKKTSAYSIFVALALVLALIIQPASVFAGSTFVWEKKSDLPAANAGGAVVEYNGKIYLFGGSTGSGIGAAEGTKSKATYVYDPSTDTWTQKSNMPSERSAVRAAVLNDKIYVVGGYNGLNGTTLAMTKTLQIYDPIADTWTTGTDMVTARAWAAVTAIDGKVYVFGGASAPGTYLKSVEAYDPVTNKWTAKSSIPKEIPQGVVAQVYGDIYLANNVTSDFWKYDYVTDTYQAKANWPQTAGDAGAVTVNNKLYILGRNSSTNVSTYDPIENKWTSEFAISSPRIQYGAVAINEKIYIVGGTTAATNGLLKTVEMLNLAQVPEQPEVPVTGRAILNVTLDTGLEKEFDLSMNEVNSFISWYESKAAGTGTASYAIDKHDNNKGPFKSRKDYVIFDKILTFEVNEYEAVE